MNLENKYISFAQVSDDYDNRILRKDDALAFLDSLIINKIILTPKEIIKMAKIIFLLSGKYSDILKNFILYIFEILKGTTPNVFESIFLDTEINRNTYDLIDKIVYLSKFNVEVFLQSIKYIEKYIITINEDELLEICKGISIFNKINNYQDVSITLHQTLHDSKNDFMKYLLLYYNFSLIIEYKMYNIENSIIKSDIELIEKYDSSLFWHLLQKVIYYCDYKDNQNLINYLFNKLSIYLDKDIDEIYDDLDDYIKEINKILYKNNDISNLYEVYKKYIDSFLSSRTLTLKLFFIVNPCKHNLFSRFAILLLKNEKYINHLELLNYLEEQLSWHLQSIDSYIEVSVKINIIKMYISIGENEIALKRILSIFIDIDFNYDYDYYSSSYDNLTNFLSNITDKEILIKLFNYLFFNISRQTETEKKFMYYISIISILEALNEDRYFFKFKRLFKIDYIPEEIKSQILAYYQRIFVIKDKSEKRKILFMQSLVWESDFEDKDLVFKNQERIKDILNLFSSVDKILGQYE